MKSFIFLSFLILTVGAAPALADINLPTIEIKLLDLYGAPVAGVRLRLRYTYKAWGVGCRKPVPALCRGCKTEGLDPIDLPHGITESDGVAKIQGAVLPFEFLIAKNPELEIDGSLGSAGSIRFLQCLPAIELTNNNTALKVADEHAIKNLTSRPPAAEKLNFPT